MAKIEAGHTALNEIYHKIHRPGAGAVHGGGNRSDLRRGGRGFLRAGDRLHRSSPVSDRGRIKSHRRKDLKEASVSTVNKGVQHYQHRICTTF